MKLTTTKKRVNEQKTYSAMDLSMLCCLFSLVSCNLNDTATHTTERARTSVNLIAIHC